MSELEPRVGDAVDDGDGDAAACDVQAAPAVSGAAAAAAAAAAGAAPSSSSSARASPLQIAPLQSESSRACWETKKELRERFEKWGLLKHCRKFSYRYDELVREYDMPAFLQRFFDSPVVRGSFAVCTRAGAWSALPAASASATASKVEFRPLRATLTNVAFFDRLQEAGIVRPSGHIQQMFEEDVDGVLVSNQLQQLFVDEACENSTLYSGEERDEVLFVVLRALVLGGGVNQYDDEFEPYVETARELYKDMCAVQKSTATQRIEVVSFCASVTHVDGVSLFPFVDPRNLCLVCVDPVKRHVHVWYVAYIPVW